MGIAGSEVACGFDDRRILQVAQFLRHDRPAFVPQNFAFPPFGYFEQFSFVFIGNKKGIPRALVQFVHFSR